MYDVISIFVTSYWHSDVIAVLIRMPYGCTLCLLNQIKTKDFVAMQVWEKCQIEILFQLCIFTFYSPFSWWKKLYAELTGTFKKLCPLTDDTPVQITNLYLIYPLTRHKYTLLLKTPPLTITHRFIKYNVGWLKFIRRTAVNP